MNSHRDRTPQSTAAAPAAEGDELRRKRLVRLMARLLARAWLREASGPGQVDETDDRLANGSGREGK